MKTKWISNAKNAFGNLALGTLHALGLFALGTHLMHVGTYNSKSSYYNHSFFLIKIWFYGVLCLWSYRSSTGCVSERTRIFRWSSYRKLLALARTGVGPKIIKSRKAPSSGAIPHYLRETRKTHNHTCARHQSKWQLLHHPIIFIIISISD